MLPPPVGPARHRSSGARGSSASWTPSSAITSTCWSSSTSSQGMSPDAARREALRVFGAVEAVKDDVRDHWLSRFFEIAAQDVRYGVAQPAPQARASRSSSSSPWRSASAPTPRSSASSTACCCARCPTATATSSSSSTTARGTRSPTTWASRSKDIADYRRGALLQRHRRVPQHVLQPARPRRSPSGCRPASCRRTTSTCSACSRCYGRTFVAPTTRRARRRCWS